MFMKRKTQGKNYMNSKLLAVMKMKLFFHFFHQLRQTDSLMNITQNSVQIYTHFRAHIVTIII